jgi:hypothetical protein
MSSSLGLLPNTAGQCSGCIYSSGNWISCTGQGTCRNGYVVCTDRRPSGGGCSGTCTCKSACICCGCFTPTEMAAEQNRLHTLVASQTTAN